MSTLLQDMMGLLKRNKKTTPKNNDYIAIARFSKPQDRLKPNPKVIERLVKLDDLKSYVNAANTGTQRLIVGGYNGDFGSPAGHEVLLNTLQDAGGNPITVDFTGTAAPALKINLSDPTIIRDNSLVIVSMEYSSPGEEAPDFTVVAGVLTVTFNGNVDAYYKVVLEQI